MFSSRNANWYLLVVVMVVLFTISTSLTIYSGVDPKLALIANVLQSLQIPYNLIAYSAAANPYELVANLMDTIVFALLTVILATWFYDFITSVSIKERLVLSRIKGIRNHVIVAPYNGFAYDLMKSMKEAGVEGVAIVDNRRELLNLLHQDFLAVIGDIKATGSFEVAGIARAKYLVAVSENDLHNALVSITAKTVNPHVRVISRVNKEDSIPKLDIAGAYKMILPEITAGELIGNELTKVMVSQ